MSKNNKKQQQNKPPAGKKQPPQQPPQGDGYTKIPYVNGKPKLTPEQLDVFTKQQYVDIVKQRQKDEKLQHRKELVGKVNEHDKTANPFFSLVLSGNAELLESYLTKNLLTDEDLLSFKNTNVVTLPHVALFPALRQIETISGNTLLHYAAMANVETCEVLLRLGMSPFINSRNQQGCSPIFLAAGRGKLDVVKFLVAHGASIEIHSATGGSLLHTAVLSGSCELVFYLLSLPKIETNVDDEEFMTPFGVLIVRLQEVKKSVEQMKQLIKETIIVVTKEITTFVIDENERIDAKREELGLNVDDDAEPQLDTNGKPIPRPLPPLPEGVRPEDVMYIGFEEQQRMIAEETEKNEIMVAMKRGIEQGEQLLNNYLDIAELLLNPPIFKLTVPEDHRDVVLTVPVGYDETKENYEADEENIKIMEEYEQMLVGKHPKGEGFMMDTKVITKSITTGGKTITHTPERAKVVHYPPYISYWMLLVETQELRLIKTCLEHSEIDINWRFDLGKTVRNATALHYAIDLDNMELIKLLVEYGADLSAEMTIQMSENGEIMTPEEQQKALSGDNKTTRFEKSLKVDEGYETLITLINSIYSKVNFFMNNVKSNYNQLKAATEVGPDDGPEAIAQREKALDVLQYFQPQQGFTPFVAALYNKQLNVAQYLLSRGEKQNFGSTYLKTHKLTPSRTLLTSDLLDDVSYNDGAFKQSQDALLQQYCNEKSEIPLQKALLENPREQISSLYQMVLVLFPYLSAPLSEILMPQINQHREQHEKQLNQMSPSSPKATDAEKQKYQLLSNILNGYHSSMVPDALRVAIKHGYDDIIYHLLRLGVDVNTPYFVAKMSMLKMDRVAQGLDYDYTITIELTDLGFSPLYTAVKTRNTQVIKQLLSINADVNTSLYNYLLARGVDINQTYTLPLTTPNAAKPDAAVPKIRVVFYTPTPIQPLIVNAIQYHPDVVNMLVNYNPYILKQITSEQRNVLHYTCELNKPVATTYVLSNDVSTFFRRDRFGLTPMAYAINHDHYELVSLLCGFMKRYHFLSPTYHPQREVVVNTADKQMEILTTEEEVHKYYAQLEEKHGKHMLPYYPNYNIVEQDGDVSYDQPEQDRLDFDDIDEEVDSTATKKSTADGGDKNFQLNNIMVVKPYWCDEITDMKEFIFLPKGFDSMSYQSYQRYILSVYQPGIHKSLPPNETIPEFISYQPEYQLEQDVTKIPTTGNVSTYNPFKQQLQTNPNRWLGFDITCANYLSFYYALVNANSNFEQNDKIIAMMEPIVKQIDGVYGHVIRAYRLASLTGSVLSLRLLHNLFYALPQADFDADVVNGGDLTTMRKYLLSNKATGAKQFKKYNLWVELVVPTEEQLATRIYSFGGYQLLANNIVVDPHGFITRNVTYEYAAKMHQQTTGRGIINTRRLCLPLRTYLATEILSSVSKQGFSSILMECLTRQALPLLHGLTGVTFIRCFHQFYVCNPLYIKTAPREGSTDVDVNLDGTVFNRTPSFPFTPYMEKDILDVQIPLHPVTRYYNNNTTIGPSGLVMQNINVYKTPSYSPLHLAVANDHLPVVRLLIGLSTNPDEAENGDEQQVQSTDMEGVQKPTGLDGFEQTPLSADHLAMVHNNNTPLDQLNTKTEEEHPVFANNSIPDVDLKSLQELVQLLNLEGFVDPADQFDPEKIAQLEKDMEGKRAKEIATKEADNAQLPPLLHIPQPTSPVFQLINRCYTQTTMVPDPEAVLAGKSGADLPMKEVQNIIHPLHLCALNDLVDVGEVLIQYGAIIDVQDHDGNTPLHLAIRDCSRLFAEVLLNYNAAVNVQNIYGDTPIHLAVQCGYVDIAKVMIEKFNPDLTIKNKQGKTISDLMADAAQKDDADANEQELIDFDRLLQGPDSANEQTDKPEGVKMTAEEKRKYNQRQILLLRKEVEKLKQQEEWNNNCRLQYKSKVQLPQSFTPFTPPNSLL